MNKQYSELSLQITKQLDKNIKKEYGIFITPKIIIEKLMTRIQYYIKTLNVEINNILEPACGTCEIINHIDNHFQNMNITGIEINSFIYDRIHNMEYKKNKLKILHKNFIQFTSYTTYDLIITNPPYFVCSKNDIPEEYKEYIHGRPNIFGLFILHSLKLLKPGGILAFIIPRSFLNATYYGKIRSYIKEVSEILEIIDFEKDNKFIDTQQSTFGLIIRKYELIDIHVNSSLNKICNYSMKIGEQIIFTSDLILLKKLFEGSTSLSKFGFGVKTGNIVWNEYKACLTDDSDYTLLIYNTNVTEDNILVEKKFNNDEKKQYIQIIAFNECPIMVVNRGNGNSKYNLKYAIVDIKKKYMVENHLNVIYPKCNNISKEELLEKYGNIVESFKNPKTKEFIDLFLGNNGLSKTELETIFPIYI
jgi:hypothetical protein